MMPETVTAEETVELPNSQCWSNTEGKSVRSPHEAQLQVLILRRVYCFVVTSGLAQYQCLRSKYKALLSSLCRRWCGLLTVLACHLSERIRAESIPNSYPDDFPFHTICEYANTPMSVVHIEHFDIVPNDGAAWKTGFIVSYWTMPQPTFGCSPFSWHLTVVGHTWRAVSPLYPFSIGIS